MIADGMGLTGTQVLGMGKAMTEPRIYPAPPRYQERVLETLQAAGFSDKVSQALLALEADQFHFVRRVMKGDIPQKLMDDLGAGLEATQFHALSAIVRLQCGQGRGPASEPTVGLLAQEMAVDPSRASRIAADLVDRGYLRRDVSQQDGRRSVLALTDLALALFDGFRAAKWQHTMRLFKGWTEQDILDFTRLFGAYIEGMSQQYPDRARNAPPASGT